jgi:hypothetical protein
MPVDRDIASDRPGGRMPGAPRAKNRFDRMEWGGALGDLGTLVPFVVVYIGVVGVDPFGVLLAFGVALVISGVYYRTPFPVQPMKAIGAAAATQAQTALITPGAVYGAGLVTGVVWLALGVTGAATAIARIVGRPVVQGIVLGLGLGFMLEGVTMMVDDWLLAAVGLTLTLLLPSDRVPALAVLLLVGVAYGAVRDPDLVRSLVGVSVGLQTPRLGWPAISWSEFLVGAVVLALPQVPLTLGNAVIAIREENNRLFPDRPVTERTIAVSTGLLNLFGSSVGGVPMCHGAGGMAGHVAFGARTGGAPIILGVILLALALLFSESVVLLLDLLPAAVLGVVLLMAGVELVLGASYWGVRRGARIVTVITAAFAMWNVGLAFLVGMALYHADERGWFRLRPPSDGRHRQ